MLGTYKEQSQEIPFDSLRVDDKLIINTQNNQYQFRVVDPSHNRGILTGGLLGSQPYEAVLVCSLDSNAERISEKAIKANMSLLFLLDWQNGAKHLFTSPITSIKRIPVIFGDTTRWNC